MGAMPPLAFGFDPPRVTYDRDLRWVMARAFGPVATPHGDAAAGDAAAALAERFDLAARIGSRVPLSTLQAELGEAGAERCRLANRRAVALALRQQELVSRVADLTGAIGLPIVLLKGAALILGGHAPAGSRAVADLDVLVAGGAAEVLQAALCRHGFAPCGEAYEHHLAPLASDLGLVEVHRVLWGVGLADSRRSASLEELAAAGLLRPAPGFAAGVWLPVPSALAAHAVLHGLVQHGLAPAAYPALRVLADLLDLGLADGTVSPPAVSPLISRYVTPSELAVLTTLCGALAAGDVDALVDARDASAPRRLLDHLVAGQLDRDYAHSLKRRQLERPFSDLPVAAARRAALRHALFPPRRELDALYGGPSGGVVRFLRRLRRPIDVALRALRSQLAAFALRWRAGARR